MGNSSELSRGWLDARCAVVGLAAVVLLTGCAQGSSTVATATEPVVTTAAEPASSLTPNPVCASEPWKCDAGSMYLPPEDPEHDQVATLCDAASEPYTTESNMDIDYYAGKITYAEWQERVNLAVTSARALRPLAPPRLEAAVERVIEALEGITAPNRYSILSREAGNELTAACMSNGTDIIIWGNGG